MIAQMKRLYFFKLVLPLIISALVPTSLNASDKEYIEIEIDGETIEKWTEFASLSEYNSDGKITYTRSSDYELRYEYDSILKTIQNDTEKNSALRCNCRGSPYLDYYTP